MTTIFTWTSAGSESPTTFAISRCWGSELHTRNAAAVTEKPGAMTVHSAPQGPLVRMYQLHGTEEREGTSAIIGLGFSVLTLVEIFTGQVFPCELLNPWFTLSHLSLRH